MSGSTVIIDRFFFVIGSAVLIGTAAASAYGNAIHGGWFGMALALIVPLGGLVSWIRYRRVGGVTKDAADELIGWLAFAMVLYTSLLWS